MSLNSSHARPPASVDLTVAGEFSLFSAVPVFDFAILRRGSSGSSTVETVRLAGNKLCFDTQTSSH